MSLDTLSGETDKRIAFMKGKKIMLNKKAM